MSPTTSFACLVEMFRAQRIILCTNKPKLSTNGVLRNINLTLLDVMCTMHRCVQEAGVKFWGDQRWGGEKWRAGSLKWQYL